MGFNFPRPPSQLIFPQTAEHVANLVMAVLVVLSALAAAREWVRGRGPLALVLLTGGLISYLNEPMLDVLGLLWHPRPGQDIAIDTFGPAPLWGLGIYTVFFGGGTALLVRLLQGGVSRVRVWSGLAILLAVDLTVELPLMGLHLYVYYGYRTPPMDVAGLPLYWLFMNAGAPLLAACCVIAAPGCFSGRRLYRALLLPMTAYGAFSLASGWPIFTALHMRTLPAWLEWAAALLTIVISLELIDAMAGWLAGRQARPVAT